MSVSRYKLISKGALKNVEPKFKTYVPSPTEDDYKDGYIWRYFCQRANDKNAPIQEVDQKTYRKLLGGIFYTAVSIKWKISDAIKPSSTMVNYKSVEQSNLLSIKTAYETMPSLKLYLPNLLQFYKK